MRRAGTEATPCLHCIRHVNPSAASIELDVTVHQRVQREIGPLTDTSSRVELRAHLADEDVARTYLFAAEPLHPAALGIAVAPVSAGTLTFFVCHDDDLFAGTLRR